MKEKPLCGYCYNECTDECCDKRRVDVLERQLEDARELEKKAFWSALNITDEDFNSRDTGGNCFDEVKQIFWDEYQEQLKEKG